VADEEFGQRSKSEHRHPKVRGAGDAFVGEVKVAVATLIGRDGADRLERQNRVGLKRDWTSPTSYSVFGVAPLSATSPDRVVSSWGVFKTAKPNVSGVAVAPVAQRMNPWPNGPYSGAVCAPAQLPELAIV
jgi:hypothetical protein